MSIPKQAVILAGGRGTRMGEDTLTIPKPMLKIGRMPILWNIMKNLYHQGIHEFIILTGFKGEVIREFFRNYEEYKESVVQYGVKDRLRWSCTKREDWNIVTIDTGLDTLTGGRLLKARCSIEGSFILTYGDGLADINLEGLSQRAIGYVATMTAVHPPGRFGTLDIVNGLVHCFKEKPSGNDWINGGFMYITPDLFEYLREDEMIEMGGIQRAMERWAVGAYKHEGFWQCVDTARELEYVNKLWNEGKAPWKNWSLYEDAL